MWFARGHRMRPVRVWAPDAGLLQIVLGDGVVPARRDADGWWTGPEVATGVDYAIRVDGGPPIPDPRSRWQPDGVHGASRALDPAAFATDRDAIAAPALRDAVIYELHVGTFSAEGTFASAVAHLDQLVELGVTHVELMPVAQFPGRHGWGYDGVDMFAAHAGYGGPAGLHELIRACHRRGLAVLIDVVLNHFGPEGAYQTQLAPYTTTRYATPWGTAINLDGRDAHEVRRFLLDSALAWLADYGADGLRLDAVHALFDRSERHLVAELVDEVRALERERNRRFVLIGEYDDHDPSAVRERAAGGWGLDAHWNDDFHHAVHVLVAGERHGYYADFAAETTLAKVLEHGYALDGGYSQHRGGPHGMPYGDLPRDRLVAYVQSHDQVGNRPAGERLAQLAGIERAKVAAALLFTSPFVPMIFQGEDWAASTPFHYFADLGSPELRGAVIEGRRREHGGHGAFVDPLAPATRDASTLRWGERTAPPHAEMLDWYRRLIALRKSSPALRDPDPRATRVRREAPHLWTVERGELALVCNLAAEPARAALGEVLLASTGLADSRDLPAHACAIVRR